MTDDEAPPWAEVLLNSLFTGARLDFNGVVIPAWLHRRLDEEYGMPVPTGERAVRPASPVDLDDEINPPHIDDPDGNGSFGRVGSH